MRKDASVKAGYIIMEPPIQEHGVSAATMHAITNSVATASVPNDKFSHLNLHTRYATRMFLVRD